MNDITLNTAALIHLESTGLVDISEFYTYYDEFSNRHCLAAKLEMEQFFILAVAVGRCWSSQWIIDQWADYNYNESTTNENTEYYWPHIQLSGIAQKWLDDNRG